MKESQQEDNNDDLDQTFVKQAKTHMLLNLADQTVQNYMKMALRNFDLKVFKCAIYLTDQDQPLKTYFTNRFELSYSDYDRGGTSPVHARLESIEQIMNSTNLEQCLIAHIQRQ